MSAGFSTPLVDLFRQEGVDREVRLVAARGALALRAHEQLALLVLLVADSDAEVARVAEGTLAAVSRDVLAAFLGASDVSPDVRAFFEARGIRAAGAAMPEPDAPLADLTEGGASEEDAASPDAAGEPQSVVQRLSGMTAAQRMVRAMRGSREERAILVRDPNRTVSTAVLSSPKLTEREVESIARMPDVSEDVLRIIGRTRAWMKTYTVAAALAKNPKTPVAMSMNLLARLTDRDLKMISIDRNVPDVVRAAARRKLVVEG
jgi:hypothetical protein